MLSRSLPKNRQSSHGQGKRCLPWRIHMALDLVVANANPVPSDHREACQTSKMGNRKGVEIRRLVFLTCVASRMKDTNTYLHHHSCLSRLVLSLVRKLLPRSYWPEWPSTGQGLKNMPDEMLNRRSVWRVEPMIMHNLHGLSGGLTKIMQGQSIQNKCKRFALSSYPSTSAVIGKKISPLSSFLFYTLTQTCNSLFSQWPGKKVYTNKTNKPWY